jgi:hypothetical protein
MFRVDAEQTSAKRIYNLGHQTLLLSDKRCISVNAEHFLAVRQNCYIKHVSYYILCNMECVSTV